MNPKVSVIIPTLRRSDLLRKCLESLRRQTFSNFETVLVSNGAGNWVGALAQEFGCTLVSFPVNRGFAAAVNAGIAASQSSYVAILNDDVQLDRNWLALTAGLLDQTPEVSFCCGKIYQADGTLLDNVGDAVSLGGSAWRLGYGRPDSAAFDLPRPVFAVPGTAALFRRSVWEEIGGLDDDFFAYLEDIDFSWRAARAGYRGFYLPTASCHHQGSATLGGPDSAAVFRLLTRNQLLLLAKHYPWRLLLRLGTRIAWAQLLWALMAVRKRLEGPYLAGVASFLWLLPRAVRKRRRWQRDEWRTLLPLLQQSERDIYEDTMAADRTAQDTFWKMYFWLFPARQAPEASAKPGLGRLPI